jgi:HD-GYP domain-containing protein (c-di-GMP phosphodiesterase class II)
VETQTPLPLSVGTRDHARAALARAFEEAAVMPGTLLPHEILEELTGVAHAIVHEVASAPDFGDRAGPAAYNLDHSINATVVGLLIGRRLVPGDDLGDLGLGLFLQDIGKLALPPRLVHKEGPLAPDEWELMMRHPVLGLELLRDDTIPARAKSVVRSHHERWDGSGYPGGLLGQEISDFARIAAVADVFDALTSERYHAPAVSRHQGLATVLAGSGTAFDPKVVETFLVAAGV